MTANAATIRVSEIGEFIRHQSCERRFKLESNRRRLARRLPFAERLFNSLDPVLREAGKEREDEWEESLRTAGLTEISPTAAAQEPEVGDNGRRPLPWREFVEGVRALPQNADAFGREVSIQGDINGFAIEGRIDFVVVIWRDERPYLRLVECKASRRDRTYHRIQLALYVAIVKDLLTAAPIEIGEHRIAADTLEAVVARIDETTNEAWPILHLPALELEMELADVERLLSPGGRLDRIAQTDLDDLEYEINEKCDGCVFNVDCLPESARRRALQLLGVDPSTVRILATEGVTTIDHIADLDLGGEPARRLRSQPGLTDALERLQVKAKARRRTLPGGDGDPDEYEVASLPYSGESQLPRHEVDGRRLVRIYLCVDYDYTENRIGALSAHVTASDHQVATKFRQVNERWQTDSDVVEQRTDEVLGQRTVTERPLRGVDITEYVPQPWTGEGRQDTGVERQLIQSFFRRVVDAIAEVAESPEASIHFYVWSRSEMTRLVEGCSRSSSRLLGSLRELLGCRESLEQLIYSSVQSEVDRRFGLGWTGRGMAPVTSLRWFGQRYHWTRRIAGIDVRLDDAFTQDIFDFKTTLAVDASGNWTTDERNEASRHRYEIRSRFHDSLPAPYWRAQWRTLPDPAGIQDTRLRNSIQRYNRAGQPGVLTAYLKARTHALRWIEERVRFKNDDIAKPLVVIADLPDFNLGIDDAAQAGIDFLRLDQHVKVTDWLVDHVLPVSARAASGRTLPVRDVSCSTNGQMSATIDAEGSGLSLADLGVRSTISEGSFVRLSPCASDQHRGQTIGQLTRAGRTCVVTRIDWQDGSLELEVMPMRADRYRLSSLPATEGDAFDFATIDESPSDFVAGRVDRRLNGAQGNHAYHWFDPEQPQVPRQMPPQQQSVDQCLAVIERLVLPNGAQLADDQRNACRDGLLTRVQLLLGPPGTGKTTTTAVQVLSRILARRSVGQIVVVVAHTHTAVDLLLRRINALQPRFSAAATGLNLAFPQIRLAKVHSTAPEEPMGDGILDITADAARASVVGALTDSVLVVGGTTSAVLKMTEALNRVRPFSQVQDGLQAHTLIVDEASMMVFPHFLSIATLLNHDGDLLLAGDHRQLAPILAHDWEREDRPPVVLYQSFASAFEAIQSIIEKGLLTSESVKQSALSFTFRLPPLIRDLIARLYRLDAVELSGSARGEDVRGDDRDPWGAPWTGTTGLFLVLHNERASKQLNETEAEIVSRLLAAAPALSPESVGVITPHRAQRTRLRSALAQYPAVDVIDTVERFQGGERQNIIVSATASDPAAIAASVEFILDLNRSNVAFSRAQDRLIVVCAETLLDHIPPETEDYQSAMLWKSLRALCSRQIAETMVDGVRIRVLTPSIEALA